MSRLPFLFAVILGSAAPAYAEPQPIVVNPQEDWEHEPTGLNFPARITDLARDRIVSFLGGENNIGATYYPTDDDEILSIYVYRSGSYDVSMMADASIAAISSNERVGAIDRGNAIFSTFGDPAIGEGSGVLATFPVDGNYRSTAIALFRSGNWLIKLRYSSKAIDAAALDRRMALLAAGLPIDPPGRKAPPAYRIESCGDVPARPQATRRELALTDWILATTAVSIAYDDEAMGKLQGGPVAEDMPRLCRDRRSESGRMFYREAESGNPRAIVFGDSGTVADVAREAISLDDDIPPPVILSLNNGMLTQLYQGFESIPGFRQMLEVLQEGGVQATVERTPEGTEITLPPTE